MSEKKLRPVITPQQLAYMIDLVEADSRGETQKIRDNFLQYLKVFQLKANLGIVSAAYTSAPKQSIEDKLGFEETPAEKRAAAYKLYSTNPNLCTPQQVSLAKTYMYETGLMTAEEEKEYENSI